MLAKRLVTSVFGLFLFANNALAAGGDAFGTAAGQQCAQQFPIDFGACQTCVMAACGLRFVAPDWTTLSDLIACASAGFGQCGGPGGPGIPVVPVPNPSTSPVLVPSLAAVQQAATVTVVVAGGGYIVYQYGGAVLGYIGSVSTGGGATVAFPIALVGLPIVLGTAAGNTFTTYVENYNIGINNGVTGSGPTGTGQCPPGQMPVTTSLGTACVADPFVNPPTPACSSLASAAALCPAAGTVPLIADFCANSFAYPNTTVVLVPTTCLNSEGQTSSINLCSIPYCANVD